MPDMPPVVIVAAVARNRVIGARGELPWRLPADMKRFRSITLGKPMIMGRKTFEAIGRPLPGRRIIVVTRDGGWSAAGVEAAASLQDALALAAQPGPEEIVIAGGGEIYAQALRHADRMRLTLVEAAPEGDARFPEFDPHAWRETWREQHPAENGQPAFAFVDYVRAAR